METPCRVRSLMAALSALLAMGCASSPPDVRASDAATPIKPITEAASRDCLYLDDVVGTSSLYGVFAEQGLTSARAAALAKVRALGGDSIVLGAPQIVHGSTSVTGRAYRCPIAPRLPGQR